MSGSQERRHAARVRVDLPVEFTAKDGWDKLPGVATDISLAGMFVATAFPAAFGAAVLVSCTPPGHRGPILLSGTVRWTHARGMGVQFGSLGARETRAIMQMQRELSGR